MPEDPPRHPDWVLDVTFFREGEPLVFYPYGDEVVTGLAYMAEICPGNLVGIIHEDGQEAAQKWCDEHADGARTYADPRRGKLPAS